MAGLLAKRAASIFRLNGRWRPLHRKKVRMLSEAAITYLGELNRPAYSPPGTGGEAAHQKKAAKQPLKAQTGWSFRTDHPVRAFLTFDGASTLLFQESP